jgi:hypothetical protein
MLVSSTVRHHQVVWRACQMHLVHHSKAMVSTLVLLARNKDSLANQARAEV